MKKIVYKYMAVALLVVSSLTAAAQTQPVSVICNELKLKGNNVYIDATIRVDADYVKSKKSLTLTPILETNNQKMGLPSVLLNGKNRQKVYDRQIALGNIEDEPRYAVIRAYEAPEHTIAYKQVIPWEPWMADAQFAIAEDLCGCGIEEASIIPIGGPIARIPEKRYQPSPAFAYVQPEQAPEVGSAYIEFVVARYEVRPNFRGNAAELAKVHESIEKVQNSNNLEMTGIELKGFASPEDTYPNNTKLAANRARSMSEYIANKYNFDRGIFTLNSEPEDWAGFKQRVEADQNVPNRSGVLAIINSNDEPDTKEAKLKALDGGRPYAYVLREIFPELRRTDYAINYVMRGVNLQEAREQFNADPNKLVLPELYAVADSYPKGSDQFNRAMEVAVAKYSDNAGANLNAANVAMSQGNLSAARGYLAKAGNSGQANLARGILAMLEGNYTEAQRLLEQARAAGVQEAGANLEELQKKLDDNALFDSFKE